VFSDTLSECVVDYETLRFLIPLQASAEGLQAEAAAAAARAEAAERAAAEAAAAGEALQAELERARKAHQACARPPPSLPY
jgi:hypothetical protein